MKLLLISNSTNAGEEYLSWPRQFIAEFTKKYHIKKVLFVPFAGVNLSNESLAASYDEYERKVKQVFDQMGIGLSSIHHHDDPKAAIEQAECVVVGGGNTFHLVGKMQETGIMQAIQKRAKKGMPFIGWSAGSNVACPTLCTTNDMPIYQPKSFDCMGLVPFQINPHYIEVNPVGHGGETRQQRIEEFLTINKEITVVGLRESSLLEMENDKLVLKGSKDMRVFRCGQTPKEIVSGTDVSFLL